LTSAATAYLQASRDARIKTLIRAAWADRRFFLSDLGFLSGMGQLYPSEKRRAESRVRGGTPAGFFLGPKAHSLLPCFRSAGGIPAKPILLSDPGVLP